MVKYRMGYNYFKVIPSSLLDDITDYFGISVEEFNNLFIEYKLRQKKDYPQMNNILNFEFFQQIAKASSDSRKDKIALVDRIKVDKEKESVIIDGSYYVPIVDLIWRNDLTESDIEAVVEEFVIYCDNIGNKSSEIIGLDLLNYVDERYGKK